MQEAPRLISSWEHLAQCKSSTHYIEVDFDRCNAWVFPHGKSWEKGFDWGDELLLTSHTFYGKTHEESTKQLQKRGFNVIIDNWDKEE